MKRLVIKEGWVWFSLVALSLFGFSSYEAQGSAVAYLALAAGVGKFFIIFLDFMEMKHAHWVWRASMLLFMLVLFGGISFSL